MDLCNLTTKDRGKLRICELELHHDGEHRDGAFAWVAAASASTGERIFDS